MFKTIFSICLLSLFAYITVFAQDSDANTDGERYEFITNNFMIFSKPQDGHVISDLYNKGDIITGVKMDVEGMASIPYGDTRAYVYRPVLKNLSSNNKMYCVREAGGARTYINPTSGYSSCAQGTVIYEVDDVDNKWVIVNLDNGDRRFFMKKANLSELSPKETSMVNATKFKNKVTSKKGNIYKVITPNFNILLNIRGSVLHNIAFKSVYEEGDVIEDVTVVDKEWLSIPLGEDGQGLVKATRLERLSEEELIAMYGTDSETVGMQRATTKSAPGFTVFNGWRAGKYAVWLIIIASLVLLVLTGYQWIRSKILSGKLLKYYGWLLVLISILEIWYFTTLKFDNMAWFLGKGSGKFIVMNFVLFLIVAVHQVFAIYTYTLDVQVNYKFKFSQRWTFGGLIISLLIYGFSWFLSEIGLIAPIGTTISHEVLIVLCVFMGQLPQVLSMIFSYRKQGDRAYMNRILGIAVVYLLASTGAVCLATMTAGVLIAVVLSVVLSILIFKSMFVIASEALTGDSSSGNGNRDNSGGGDNYCCANCRRFIHSQCIDNPGVTMSNIHTYRCGSYTP